MDDQRTNQQIKTDVSDNHSSSTERLIQLIEEADVAMRKGMHVKALMSIQMIADLSLKTHLQSITKIALAIEAYGVYENLDLTKELLAKLKSEILNLNS